MAKLQVTKLVCDATGEEYEEGAEGSASVRVDVVGEDYIRNLDFSPEAVKKLPNPDTKGSRRARPGTAENGKENAAKEEAKS